MNEGTKIPRSEGIYREFTGIDDFDDRIYRLANDLQYERAFTTAGREKILQALNNPDSDLYLANLKQVLWCQRLLHARDLDRKNAKKYNTEVIPFFEKPQIEKIALEMRRGWPGFQGVANNYRMFEYCYSEGNENYLTAFIEVAWAVGIALTSEQKSFRVPDCALHEIVSNNNIGVSEFMRIHTMFSGNLTTLSIIFLAIHAELIQLNDISPKIDIQKLRTEVKSRFGHLDTQMLESL